MRNNTRTHQINTQLEDILIQTTLGTHHYIIGCCGMTRTILTTLMFLKITVRAPACKHVETFFRQTIRLSSNNTPNRLLDKQQNEIIFRQNRTKSINQIKTLWIFGNRIGPAKRSKTHYEALNAR